MADEKPPLVKFDLSKILPIVITAIIAILGTLQVAPPQPSEKKVEVTVSPAPAPVATATATAPQPVVKVEVPTAAPPLRSATPDPISQSIQGPGLPVDVGRLARFTLPANATETATHWRVVARSLTVADATVVEADGGLTAFVETAEPCTYDVSVAGLIDGKVFHWATTFEVVGTKPIPPPGPGPQPQPVVGGPKKIVVLRESLEPTPEMGRLIVQMESGPIGSYLAEKKHEFESFDKDAKDETGAPSAYVRPFLDAAKGATLPAVVIVELATGKVVHSQALGEHPTAAALLEIVKGHGG